MEHFRYWITSIVLKNDTSENFRIEFKENVKSPGDDEEQKRLDFIVGEDPETGKHFGPAWKNFGYKGPRYHDGFLYGELDEKLDMTGTLSICFHLSTLLFRNVSNLRNTRRNICHKIVPLRKNFEWKTLGNFLNHLFRTKLLILQYYFQL